MKKQGYLYWGNVPDNAIVSGKRPFLVLSKDQINNNYIVVAPLISVQGLPEIHIPISDKEYPINNGIIGLDRISTIKSEYLTEEICKLKEEELKKIKDVLHNLLF
nr:type II toxin-antitoxin system PemK/MazF family toxin [Fredinandcohnia onubensis]